MNDAAAFVVDADADVDNAAADVDVVDAAVVDAFV